MKDKAQSRKRQDVQVFSTQDAQCIWMKAGVVNFKLCDNAYDCLSCAFDKAMSRKLQQKPEKTISWRQAQRGKAYNQKECRHMLTGRVQFHLCASSYRCNVCEFDQTLDESDMLQAPGASHTHKVSGFHMADSYYYHRGHAWARIEHGGFVRMGIDDFAMRLLGQPTDITLPKLGSHVEQTEVGWTVRREEKIAAMLAPMNGVVVATNHRALGKPESTRKDPYGEGWLMVIEPRDLRQSLKNLLFDQEAATWLSAEVLKLEGILAHAYGMPMAATGGEMVDDIYGNISHLVGWDDLVHEFLLT